MASTRFQRIALGLVLMSPAGVASLTGMPARGTVAEAKATVLETVAVRAGMGADNGVVGQLQEGEVVTIDIELTSHAGRWCRVIPQGGTSPVGFVPCDSLDRQAGAGTRWTLVGSKSSAPPDTVRASRQDEAKAGGEAQPGGEAKPLREKRPYSDVKVLFYVTWWCPQCRRARTLLQSLGVSVTEYDIEREPAREEEMVAKSGQNAIPVIDIEGIVLVGFGESDIREAVEKRRSAG